MTQFKVIRWSLVVVLTGLLAGVGGCAYGPYHHTPPPSRTIVYPNHYYDYYYYPHMDVYFHIYLGHYYYRSGKNWVRVRQLPAHVYLDNRYRTLLHTRDDKPYLKYREHRDTYRPRVKYKAVPERERRDVDRHERTHNDRSHREYLKKRGDNHN